MSDGSETSNQIVKQVGDSCRACWKMASSQSLSAPLHLLSSQGLHRCMKSLEVYVAGNINSGRWRNELNTEACVAIDDAVDWFNRCSDISLFLNRRQFQPASRLLRICLRTERQLISADCFRFLFSIYTGICLLFFYPEVVKYLLAFAHKSCKELHGESHPLTAILQEIKGMSPGDMLDNWRSLMECYYDHLASHLKYDSELMFEVVRARNNTIRHPSKLELIDDYVVESSLLHDIATWEGYTSNSSYEVSLLKRQILQWYSHHGREAETHAISSVLLESNEVVRCLKELVEQAFRKQDTQTGFRLLRERMLYQSYDAMDAVRFIARLEATLRETGQTALADKVLQELDASIETAYTSLEEKNLDTDTSGEEFIDPVILFFANSSDFDAEGVTSAQNQKDTTTVPIQELPQTNATGVPLGEDTSLDIWRWDFSMDDENFQIGSFEFGDENNGFSLIDDTVVPRDSFNSNLLSYQPTPDAGRAQESSSGFQEYYAGGGPSLETAIRTLTL